MKRCEMYRIIMNIDDEKISDEEKGIAIKKMLNMETHNSVTKRVMIKIIRYMWDLCFEWREK